MVIAIIAILAAIFFPVFAKAREKARETSCLSNEGQIGLGLIQYSQDYDELNVSRSGTTGSWKTLMQLYVKNTQVFACPSYPRNHDGDFDNTEVVSYAVNTCSNSSSTSTGNHWNRPFADM